MNNYDDYTKWVEETFYKHDYCFNQYEKLSPQKLFDVAVELVQKGQEEGLEGCYLKLESTMEPYEDYLGEPIMQVVGYRLKNADELKWDEREDYIKKKAKEMDTTEYNARKYVELEELGLINGNDT